MAKQMARRKRTDIEPPIFDAELADMPADLRWREWMNRIEAVLFAAPKPVERDALARVIGCDASIDLLIEDIREALRGKPYDVVSIAGGWAFRTRAAYADAIATSAAVPDRAVDLTQNEAMVLVSIAYHQPVTPGWCVRDSGARGVARCDRGAAGQEYDHRGTAQPDGGGAVHLCDNQGVFGAFRAGYVAGSPRYRGDAGRRIAEWRPFG